MGPARRTLELFYDVLSPYSWLGFEVLCRYQHLWNIKLHLRPALIAGIMNDSGNKPPAMVPRKGQYMNKEMLLLGQQFQVPLNIPEDINNVMFKKGSLNAMRFLTAVSMEQPEVLEKVSRELWMRIWSRDEDITEAQSILAAAEKAGMSTEQAQRFLEKISTAQVKNKLKETTDAACSYGERSGWALCLQPNMPDFKIALRSELQVLHLTKLMTLWAEAGVCLGYGCLYLCASQVPFGKPYVLHSHKINKTFLGLHLPGQCSCIMTCDHMLPPP